MYALDSLKCAAALFSALRSERFDLLTLQKRQMARLRSQLRHAFLRVPYYRMHYAQKYDPVWFRRTEDLSCLPLLRRSNIQREPHAFLDEQGDRSTWFESHTSGSLGRPLQTWFDTACWHQTKYALKARRVLACGWRPGHRTVVVDDIFGNRLQTHETASLLTGERLFGMRRYVTVFEPLDRHISVYGSFRPHFIYGFPSYFNELAAVWNEKLGRHVPLKALMTSAEVLEPGTRSRLERIFGVPVLDVYGSTEFKEIAWQCPRGKGYHINMESVIVEIVDEYGKPVPEGKTGEVVVTSLTNRAMPLIRYATEDRAKLIAGSCVCGRSLPRLSGVEGRVADYLPLPGHERVSPYELTTTLSAYSSLQQFKVIQHDPDRLELLVVLKPGADEHELLSIRNNIRKRVGHHVALHVRTVTSIPREPSGKHRPVVIKTSEPDKVGA